MKGKLVEFTDDATINREYWIVCLGELDVDVHYTTHNQGVVEEVEIKKCPGHSDRKIELPGTVAKAVREYRQARR